jgi:hypothetical protein
MSKTVTLTEEQAKLVMQALGSCREARGLECGGGDFACGAGD